MREEATFFDYKPVRYHIYLLTLCSFYHNASVRRVWLELPPARLSVYQALARLLIDGPFLAVVLFMRAQTEKKLRQVVETISWFVYKSVRPRKYLSMTEHRGIHAPSASGCSHATGTIDQKHFPQTRGNKTLSR